MRNGTLDNNCKNNSQHSWQCPTEGNEVIEEQDFTFDHKLIEEFFWLLKVTKNDEK